MKLSSVQKSYFDKMIQTLNGRAALGVVERLQASGYEAYFAGGCVRDILIGRTPVDFDVATSAPPEAVEALFSKTIGVGRQFGILVVVVDGTQIEVARFRGDGEYKDGRHPADVYFSDAKEDAKRRDFTVNALFLEPLSEELIDFVDGCQDLEAKLLRAVGDPCLRFQEDHLRILRALRLSAQLEFEIESQTWKAICAEIFTIHEVSGERFFQEVDKLLGCSSNAQVINRLNDFNLFPKIFPKLPLKSEIFLNCKKYITGNSWTWLDLMVWSFLSGGTFAEIKCFLQEQKTSSSWKSELVTAMSWIWMKKTPEILEQPLGALIEMSFQPGAMAGIKKALQLTSEAKVKAILQSVVDSYLYWNCKAPPPLLRGGDLKGRAVGAELGAILKATYQAQLAQIVNSHEEALKYAFQLDCKNQQD